MIYKRTWKKVLDKDEKLEYEFSIGKGYRMFGLWFWIIIGTLCLAFSFFGLFIILCACFYYGFYLNVSNVYGFTNKRVIIHKGWLSTNITSIDYKKITDVYVNEPIFDRLITKTGHLKINTAGTPKHEVVLTHITRPYEVKKKLNNLCLNN